MANSSISIRPATEADLPTMAALFDAYRQFYNWPSNLAGAEAFLQARLQQQDSAIFLAEEEDGTALGFVQLYPQWSSVRLTHFWVLNDLFVTAEARGTGAGTALIEAAFAHAKASGACGVQLETEASNMGAQRLYERKGFRQMVGSVFYFWAEDPQMTDSRRD